MTTGVMRKTAVYAGLLAMTVGMASVQAPEGRAQGGVDRQMVYVPAGNISQVLVESSILPTNVAPPPPRKPPNPPKPPKESNDSVGMGSWVYDEGTSIN